MAPSRTTSSPFTSTSHRNRLILSCTALFIIVSLAFAPAVGNGFTNWDDDVYVTGNADLQGSPLHAVAKFFTATYACNYQPLTMLSYLADFSLFGLRPWGYHLTGVLFHALNCLLLFFIVYRLSRRTTVAFLAALLFGLHPLRVESVAWVAARKDVVSAFFYFCAVLLYLYYKGAGRRRYYFLCLGAFVGALLSKPVAVSLPIALLLLDYLEKRTFSKKLLLEKIPFFTGAAVFSVVTILVQKGGGALAGLSSLTLGERIGLPFYGLVFYPFKTVFPFRLCAFYHFPPIPGPFLTLGLIASPLIVAGAAIMLFRYRSRSRVAVFAALFYLVTVAPMLQVVTVGYAAVAERYSYIPLVGMSYAGAMALRRLADRTGRRFVALLCIALLLFWASLTVARCRVWKDGLALWNDVIAVCPSASAYNNRGLVYEGLGRGKTAMADFVAAGAMDPGWAPAYNNIGLLYAGWALEERDTGAGRGAMADSSIAYFTRAITRDSTYAYAYDNLGNMDGERKRFADAIREFTRAIALQPRVPEFYYDRGSAYRETGSPDAAIADFSAALSLKPGFASALNDRGLAYVQKGTYRLAIEDFSSALAINPNDADVRNNLNQVRSFVGTQGSP
jgi:tetratricopeptide (TPR) repeat protein